MFVACLRNDHGSRSIVPRSNPTHGEQSELVEGLAVWRRRCTPSLFDPHRTIEYPASRLRQWRAGGVLASGAGAFGEGEEVELPCFTVGGPAADNGLAVEVKESIRVTEIG